MEKEQGRAADAGLMDLLFDVIIYIYADIVLERQPKSLVSKNMNNEEHNDGHIGKWLDNNRKQRDA